MGQKVHPYGFRLGYTKPRKSRRFAGVSAAVSASRAGFACARTPAGARSRDPERAERVEGSDEEL